MYFSIIFAFVGVSLLPLCLNLASVWLLALFVLVLVLVLTRV